MVNVVNKIVVPGKPAVEAGLAVLPFGQVHYHSTGNANSSMQNEADYLKNHWQGAYYTHLVGIDGNGNAAAWQVAAVNGGSYDLGGDWNWEGYAAIEFVEGSIKTQDQFNKAYAVYIALGHQLAQEAGITDFTLDTGATKGNKTHNYASATGHGSDHVDPLPFLAKWGISYEQFKKDVKNAKASSGSGSVQKVSTSKPATSSSAIQQFKNVGNHFTNTKTFKVDKIAKVNGIWQMINYNLAGGKDADWTNNGIPLDIVDNVTRGMSPTQVGDVMKFSRGYDNGTIDKYDTATNGVGIVFGKYGIIWFNADAFIKL